MNDTVVFVLAAVNAVSFALCAADKAAAKRGTRRIPEKTLLSAAAFFGSYGMLLGMYTVRHKTKHLKFVITVPLLAAVHTVVLAFAFNK